MNENLIFEGNTIYEIDPVCIKNKNIRRENHKIMDRREMTGRMKNFSTAESCADETLQMIKLLFVFQWAKHFRSGSFPQR